MFPVSINHLFSFIPTVAKNVNENPKCSASSLLLCWSCHSGLLFSFSFPFSFAIFFFNSLMVGKRWKWCKTATRWHGVLVCWVIGSHPAHYCKRRSDCWKDRGGRWSWCNFSLLGFSSCPPENLKIWLLANPFGQTSIREKNLFAKNSVLSTFTIFILFKKTEGICRNCSVWRPRLEPNVRCTWPWNPLLVLYDQYKPTDWGVPSRTFVTQHSLLLHPIM